MAFRANCVALLLASLPIAGCGTVANVVMSRPEEGGVKPFGGVRQDVACIQRAASGEPGPRAHAKSATEQYPHRALALICAVDLPLSFIGDVVTWPYTVVYSCINEPIPVPPIILTNTGSPVAPPIPTPPATEPMPLPIPIPPAEKGGKVEKAKTEGRPQASP